MSGDVGGWGGAAERLLLDTGEVLAIDKPAGLSMATSSRPGRSEADVVARLLDAARQPSTPHAVRLVHRLDVGTTGVVLLAKDAATHRRLSLAIQERRVSKSYRALAWGHPVPARGLLDAPLSRDRKDGRKMRVDAAGSPALTRYETLRRLPSVADLRLFPLTGRTHQIRVHLAHRGHPIVGDDLYGAAARWHGVRDPRLRAAFAAVVRPLLHAERIVVEDLGVDVTAPLPRDHAVLLELLRSSRSRRPGDG